MEPSVDPIQLLVVDDDAEICELLADYLGDKGYRVDTAGDGAGLRRRFAAGGVDLVILDVQLPGEDGLDLCRMLRRDSDVPIIMLTARGEEADRIVGLELGADDYMVKPFSPRELLARIKAIRRRIGDRSPVVDAAVDQELGGHRAAMRISSESETIEIGGWRLHVSDRQLVD